MTASYIFAAGFALALGLLLMPRIRKATAWRAVITPLASIIGSGFLVSAPLLAAELGHYAILAMAGLIAIAYLIGAAIRFNIAHAEPLLGSREGRGALWWIEQASHLALAFAYFISVAYYLSLLASFLLKGLGQGDAELARLITTAILAGIGLIGFFRGLKGIERVEIYTVSLNLAVIAGLLAALAWYNADLWRAGSWAWTAPPGALDLHTGLTVLGLLIVVQGFETSRFLGEEFDRPMRIRTMRWAQLVAAAVYLVFFALVTVLFGAGQGAAADGVAGIIDMMRPVALVLPVMLTLGAVASQFSASVADSTGAAGLVREISGGRISVKAAYPVVVGAAIAVVWSTDVYGIINLASRAFALFYALQCAVAVVVARRADVRRRGLAMAAYGLAGVIALAVTVFAVPSGG